MLYATPINHIPFILKPESDIVKEAISSLNSAGRGMSVYPICGYVMHSLFLKLTGAQEQKLKCICWELACRDYEYRYERFERNRFSECSDYKDKRLVYNDILNAIKQLDESFVIDDALKSDVLNDWNTSTSRMFEDSVLSECFGKEYNEYKNLLVSIGKDWIMGEEQIFVKKDNLPASQRTATCGFALFELYTNYVYKERNRCAHNTRSYQHNLPSLNSMMAEDYKLQNYFLYMSIMLLLDTIYVKLFKLYLQKSNS